MFLTGNYIKALRTMLWVGFGASLLFFFLTTPEKSLENYLYTLLISLMYSFGYGLSNGWYNDFLEEKIPWTEYTSRRVTWAIVGSLIINIVVTFGLNYIHFVLIKGTDPGDFFSAKWNFTNWFFVNLALLISAFLHARGFMLALKQNAKKEVVEQKLIAKSANAQFESLKNQLDPHFLFNSLNVLSSLIDENPQQAQQFTASMSKIYRYVLEQKDKELVSVEEELDFAQTYCALLKTRFEDSVNFEFQISEEAKKGFVVPLSLQLLLENTIKHNFATPAKPLKIKISTENGSLVIENNLQAREQPDPSTGVGLTNIVSRYSLLTDRNVFIEKSSQFFRVKLPILIEKINTMNPTPSHERLAYEKASKRVQELKGFYGNLISYCIVIPVLFFINWQTNSKYWWAFWPMLGWGLGLSIQALKTFGIGREWEERQIQKYMEKEDKNSQKWQ